MNAFIKQSIRKDLDGKSVGELLKEVANASALIAEIEPKTHVIIGVSGMVDYITMNDRIEFAATRARLAAEAIAAFESRKTRNEIKQIAEAKHYLDQRED